VGTETRGWLASAASAAVAVGIAWLAWPYISAVSHHATLLAVIIMITAAASVFGVALAWDNVTVTGSSAGSLVAIVLCGPLGGLAVGALLGIPYVWRRSPRQALFNGSMGAAMGALGGLLFTGLAGSHPVLRDGLRLAADLVAVGLVMYLVNMAWGAGMRSVIRLCRFDLAFFELVRATRLNEIGSIVIGVMAAIAASALGALGLVAALAALVLLRFIVVRQGMMLTFFLEGVDALVGRLEAKDPTTLAHSRRVAEYAVAIGREMGLDPFTLQTLRFNGLLHDIGKVEIPDEILKKPAHFTPEEYEQMKRHATLSGELTHGMWARFIGRRTEWASLHHERYDGQGYPRGLKGEEIPLGGRILSVADAFDAMTSDRPYHRGVSTQEAFEELARCAGSQFDPTVVAAFFRSQGYRGAEERFEPVAEAAPAAR
jgi:HD-GYP domain-containing protein (c-di-GMP phosphodiesterase class II)